MVNATIRDLGGFVFPLDPKAFQIRQISGIILPHHLETLAQDAKLATPFQVEVTLQLVGGRWHVKGRVAGEAELTCSRCLDPFPCPLSVEVEREYIVGVDRAAQLPELEVIEDVTYLVDGLFSVKNMAEEELITALPMVPLCRDSCAGLCQGCGAELNREPCTCKSGHQGSPFAILKGRL